jgi:hypothetical protein
MKRRLSKQRSGAITPQTVVAYQLALEAREFADRTGSEDDRDAAHAAERIVDRLLGFKFFEDTIWDIKKYGVDPEQPHSVLAAEQLRQLDEALAAAKKVAPPATAITEPVS